MPTSALTAAAIAFAAIGLLLFVAALVALTRLQPLRALTRLLVAALLVACGALAGALAIGVHGYRALTHEEIAARIDIKPLGPQRFAATFRFSDGRSASYTLAGDAIYVDAHVLKWKPCANVLGLHTAYELARVAGRYDDIDNERSAPRTVHALGAERPIDLFALRKRYAWLAPLFDAEYGSGTFAAADKPQALELRVSTTGLLLRPLVNGAGSPTPSSAALR
ncbi:MAG TPA: hypothetical protein VNK91_12925 [Burkholderiaceae bacterium]|jgi:hypothetical protein|nr:hypothetical protein [Burkholderiaceae bacterium]